MYRQALSALAIGAAAAVLSVASPANAQTVEEFFTGKTITVLVPFNPGGTTANFAQVLSEHLGKYIPGKPAMTLEFMPGGGGVLATNFAYTKSPRDGTVMLIPDQALGVTEYLTPEGVEYKSSEFQWIGIALPSRAVLMVRKDTNISSVEGLKEKEVFIGASGVGSETYMYPVMTNGLLGTKMNVVAGFPGGSGDVMKAVESGEMQGSVNGYQTWERRPDLIPQLNPILTYGIGRDPKIPDVPNLLELVSDPLDQKVVRFISSVGPIGRGAATLPGVPEDRVKAFRDAFDMVLKDEEFLAKLKELNLPVVEPYTGEEAQAFIEDSLNVSPEVLERAKKLIAVTEQ